MKEERYQKYLYPLLDRFMNDAIHELDEAETPISCRKGCSHCCYLLIEVDWYEAMILAKWVMEQDEAKRTPLIKSIRANAKEARALFSKAKVGKTFMQPTDKDADIPDALFNDYFFKKRRPCPFLEEGACTVYSHRPSPCRLHVVTSPSEYCSADPEYAEKEIDVPESVEAIAEEIGPVMVRLDQDGRWGHLGIMVEAALDSLSE